MATYEDIEYGSTTLGEILTDITINSLTTLSRGLIMELVSPYINDFNKMNYDFMNIHMMRNAFEKSITLDNIGENAYADGDSSSQATPAQYPSYTKGNNYMEFVTSVRDGSKYGTTTTRVNTINGVENKYFDSNDPDTQIQYSSSVDKNSILFKTQRLLRLNKLKTIISQFHTDPSVEYVGQIGSEYGESHGRNLLTKDAASGKGGYNINGYDNPYCRVWTNHHKYDKLSKTMRANSQLMNYWPGFEWDESDKGHDVDSTKYSDGENYDYAWRGKHNQNRRWANSVLDPKTGLVKMTPQYRGGGETNRHTKECMFSIENLAWKDYDPYSFEEALSWEQRGPFGGRIMWFPPYGIEITETTNAKWQSNDFIGRGEPVYTYVNTERSGNLSFIMLTDHPSSIDYASWWDDNNMTENTTDISGNSENDYLRYFAGCSNNSNDGENEGIKDIADNNMGLTVKPTPLTDEYTKSEPPPLIQAVIKPGPQVPEEIVEDQPPEDKTPIYVEFFVFYPNNYSGVMDYPSNSKINKDGSYVDSIAYLLAGRNANKVSDGSDFGLYLDGGFAHDDRFIGYEMDRGPITTNDCIEKGQFIQGGVRKAEKYTVEKNKKWQYRVDHIQPYTGDDKTYHNGTNLLNETISTVNLKDTNNFNLNLKVDGDVKTNLAQHKDNVYSLAEVAAAIYSEEMVNYPDLYKYLKECGVSEDRVKTLVDIFNNPNLVLNDIECKGFATTQGPQDANKFLYQNRAKTVLSWLRTVEKWKDITVNTDDNLEQIKQVDKNDADNVNGKSSKLYRSARCVMTFTSGITDQVDNTPDIQTETDDDESNSVVIDKHDIVGFRLIAENPMPNGKIWRYYVKDDSVKYYDQVVGSSDNYDEPDKDDVVIKENQIFQIFKTDGYQPEANEIMRKNSKYRGFYNEFGIYDITFDYSKSDEPDYEEFDEDETYNKNDKVIYNNHYYVANEDWHGEWNPEAFRNISATYAIGDFVLYQEQIGDVEKFYECQVNFIEKYDDYDFNPIEFDQEDWALADDKYVHIYNYGWELAGLVEKAAAVLCWTADKMYEKVNALQDTVNVNPTGKGVKYEVESNPENSCVFKYGITNGLTTTETVTTGTNLCVYAEQCESTCLDSGDESAPIRFTEEEQEYLQVLYDTYISEIDIQLLRTYIVMCRILDGIKKVENENGARNVCVEAATSDEEMTEKIKRKDESETDGCDNVWVDRGDGILIQECNIGYEGGRIKSRFDPKTGKGDWNKLRYDQEYRFYKQWIAEHPLMYEKLQEKIKYFNPAFHSMTPEGFNARCTFLQQCTRQGNTKTMSDKAGRTASNLAFGRPPYCVLRLGDFYYQMIVIENVTYDYGIAEGIQWDLNTEGNGVQPMLCKVNISFKFIGGGDITGPVQRLQNAMSFNYYANASFYDNRADRVQYQATNWATMGGAGNNEIDVDKSYAYVAKRYQETGPNMVVPN